MRCALLLALCCALASAAPVFNTIPASGPLVKLVGRSLVSGGSVLLDWEGVSFTVTVSAANFLAVNITDLCGGDSVGGGSRWGVFLTSADPRAAAPFHRVATIYTGPLTQFYYMFNLPGQKCDPACSMNGANTFTLVRLTESRLSGCSATAGLAVNAFMSDGTFVAPPPPAARRLEFIGDSITAGDLNDNGGMSQCGNAAFNDDITFSSGGQLCLPASLGGFGADCMYTAWCVANPPHSPPWLFMSLCLCLCVLCVVPVRASLCVCGTGAASRLGFLPAGAWRSCILLPSPALVWTRTARGTSPPSPPMLSSSTWALTMSPAPPHWTGRRATSSLFPPLSINITRTRPWWCSLPTGP